MPAARSPAQIEASRRNGTRSRGPVTPEGKARASGNALKHGLAALHHVAVEGEDAAELEALTGRLLAETAPESELEARLVRRMAIAFWKGERAERMEAALIAAAPRQQRNWLGTYVPADPLGTFDVRRFHAIRGYQAQQGRGISRRLRELRLLRREPLAEGTDEPEETLENEPLSYAAVAEGGGTHPVQGGCAGSEIGTNPGPETLSPPLSVIPPRILISPNG